MKKTLILIAFVAVLASCGTQKATVTGGGSVPTTTGSADLARQQLDYLRKVYDNAVYSQNIVSDIDFTLNTGSKNISVNGSLRMRKDDVIRIQLTALGLMEVGRLEFTKDYVMIVDRIHKEYIKADYNQVSFLQRNGLNFYTLQALFWNTLFMPGQEKVTDDLLRQFTAGVSSSGTTPISLEQGNMTYTWKTETNTGLIRQTDVEYDNKKDGATQLVCTYDNFRPLGSKLYPNMLKMNAYTKATQKERNVAVTIKMNGVKTDSSWETRTTVSSKYKQVSVEEVLKKITSL